MRRKRTRFLLLLALIVQNPTRLHHEDSGGMPFQLHGKRNPRRFRLGSRSIEVKTILDRWTGEDHEYFKILAEDGIYILRHDTTKRDCADLFQRILMPEKVYLFGTINVNSGACC